MNHSPAFVLAQELEREEGAPSWIVTYADLMTLILVFFILLYTLSDLSDRAFRAEISDIQVMDGDGNQVSVIDYAMQSGRNPEPLQVIEEAIGLAGGDAEGQGEGIMPEQPKLVREVESMVDATSLSDHLKMIQEGDALVLRIDGQLLFESGRASLKDDAFTIFSNLAQLFRDFSEYKIAIRGHTDDIPIETAQFPSNWELSAVRATTVLRYFIQQGIDPERMSATGYADFIPLNPNTDAELRASNRRVEFVLEKETQP